MLELCVGISQLDMGSVRLTRRRRECNEALCVHYSMPARERRFGSGAKVESLQLAAGTQLVRLEARSDACRFADSGFKRQDLTAERTPCQLLAKHAAPRIPACCGHVRIGRRSASRSL